jgi:hypothetical protein
MVSILEINNKDMAIITTSNGPLAKLCELWGLNGQKVKKITIELEWNDVAKVTVVHYMTTDQAEGLLTEVAKKYTLTGEQLSSHAKNKDCHLP